MAPWVTEQGAREPPRKLVVPGRPAGVAISPDGAMVALELAVEITKRIGSNTPHPALSPGRGEDKGKGSSR